MNHVDFCIQIESKKEETQTSFVQNPHMGLCKVS